MDLRITLIQTKLSWEDVSKNISHFSSLIKKIKTGSTDLILLPEMWSTGFSMRPSQFAETMDGSAVQWMRETAKQKKAVLCGSLMMKEENKFYNRLIWMRPDGTHEIYDKKHLFQMGAEHNNYSAGTKKIIVELKGWKISPLICYDLRFPVWSRNRQEARGKEQDANYYDLLIYAANWPERRKQAWKQLLIARAIENVSYVAGLNRIGKDGNAINHTGDSGVFDFLGNKISKTKPLQESIETIKLSKKDLEKFRKDFPVLNDGDLFEIK
ncbi:MAG: amidohydrolase [Bacteroidia bacterium]